MITLLIAHPRHYRNIDPGNGDGFHFGVCSTLLPLVLTAAIMGLSMGVAFTVICTLIVDAVPSRMRGLAMGCYNTSVYLGMTICALVMGVVIREQGFAASFFCTGGVILASVLVFGLLYRPQKSVMTGPLIMRGDVSDYRLTEGTQNIAALRHISIFQNSNPLRHCHHCGKSGLQHDTHRAMNLLCCGLPGLVGIGQRTGTITEKFHGPAPVHSADYGGKVAVVRRITNHRYGVDFIGL